MGNFNRGDRSGDRGGRDSFKGRSGGGFDRGGNRGGFGGSRDAGRPTMHKAVCSDCGADCEVPFKPTGEKPVLCSNCFGHKGSSDRGFDRSSDARRSGPRSFDRPSYEDKQMYQAVCDKCHKECEVPFRPTSGKPVYCKDCFEKENGGSRDSRDRGGINPSKEQFEILNAKLDKILRALGPVVTSDVKEAREVKKDKVKNKVNIGEVVLPELNIFEPVEEVKKSVKKAVAKKAVAPKKAKKKV